MRKKFSIINERERASGREKNSIEPTTKVEREKKKKKEELTIGLEGGRQETDACESNFLQVKKGNQTLTGTLRAVTKYTVDHKKKSLNH